MEQDIGFFSTCFRGSDIGFSSHILFSETFNRINNQVPLTSRLLTNLTYFEVQLHKVSKNTSFQCHVNELYAQI